MKLSWHVWLVALWMLAGCDEGSVVVPDGTEDATVGDDGAPPDAPPDDASPPPDDGTVETPVDVPVDTPPLPCTTPLAERVRVTEVSVAPASVETSGSGYFSPDRPVILSTQDDGTAKVGWTDGAGHVHVTPLDGNDARRAPDLTLPGTEVRGFVALSDGAAVLVRRDEDVMAVVRINDAGGEAFARHLVGDESHDVDGSRWIDDWSHDGRLAWNGSQFAAYHGQTGNHGSSGNHQGDRYVLLDPAGSPSVVWDWGCSHSLDVRLAWNGSAFGPVCLSDCYPGKGIYYNHRNLVRSEPSGDCAGGSSAELGGLVGVGDGFLLSFVSREGRSSADVGLVHVATGGTAGTVAWLTDTAGVDESGAHLAAYGANYLAGWLEGGTPRLAVVDAAGAIVEGPVGISAQFGARNDFVTWPSGDVGWAYAWGDTSRLQVVRVSRCE
ncbi:MAG: hypothetical protein JXB32_16175 [Deltaproteobacteria bacterium]|nr:hypothetical protein [Deltaproteobacteria bacterium]